MTFTSTAAQIGSQQAVTQATAGQSVALAGAHVTAIVEQTEVGVAGVQANSDIASWQATTNIGNKANQASVQMLQSTTQ